MSSPKKALLQRMSLPVKSVLVGLVCGLVAWFVSDFFQTPALHAILTQQLTERLEKEAARHRVIFDRYINQHGRAIKVLAAYQPLVWWLEHRLENESAHEVRHHRRKRPEWFPPISAWRGLIDPGYVLLRDTDQRLREVYHRTVFGKPCNVAYRVDQERPPLFVQLSGRLLKAEVQQIPLSPDS